MATTKVIAQDGHGIELPTGLFINNEFVPSRTGATLDVLNAYSEEHIATISTASVEDVDAAVEAASIAFEKDWKKTPGSVRAQLLFKLAELIERDADEFSSIEAVDAGIVFGESKALHINQSLDTLRYFASIATVASGKMLDIPGGYAYTRKEPFGVTAAIVPWNSPLMITIWKLAPAIAAGNVLIIKTPELAPLYGQKLAQLVKEAGFPPGVVNIICGLGSIAGQAISQHMKIRKLSFTGSGPTGRRILRAAADSNLKKVTIELGGKGPSLIFDDADLENALFWTTIGSTANNGQVCALGSRIYVQDSIYDKFIEAFKERATSQPIHAGNPLEPGINKGPIINKAQAEKVLNYIEKGKSDGAKVLFGGNRIGSSGNFIENTVFTGVTENMVIVKEEIFGPVATIAKFSTEEEVIAKANDSEYGLNSAIFTTNSSRAYRVSAAIEVGTVTVNCWGLLNANTPFGGVKQSGFGREMGEDALDEWTTTKTVKHLLLK